MCLEELTELEFTRLAEPVIGHKFSAPNFYENY